MTDQSAASIWNEGARRGEGGEAQRKFSLWKNSGKGRVSGICCDCARWGRAFNRLRLLSFSDAWNPRFFGLTTTKVSKDYITYFRPQMTWFLGVSFENQFRKCILFILRYNLSWSAWRIGLTLRVRIWIYGASLFCCLTHWYQSAISSQFCFQFVCLDIFSGIWSV